MSKIFDKLTKIKRLGLFTVLLFLLIATVPMAVFAGEGEFVVGEGDPTISDVTISTTAAPSINMTDWDLDPDTIYYFNMTATMPTGSTLENVVTIDFHIWLNEVPPNYTTGPLDIMSKYGFQWWNNSGTHKYGEYKSDVGFDFDSEGVYIDKALCTIPSDLTAQSGEWAFAIKVSKVATYSTSDDWKIMVVCKTDAEPPVYMTDKTHTLDVNYRSEILNFYPAVNLGSGDEGVTIGPSGPSTLVTLANDAYKITVSSTIPTDGSHTIPVGNLKIDTDNIIDGAHSLTEAEVDWVVCSRDTLEVGTSTSVYWWVIIPNPQYPGTYTFTYTHTINQGT